jgi:hypothetical protein
MILAWLLLLTGLTISAVAIYYSVVGLTAIFSAAVIPIIIMGSALEVGKLVCASWLKANWERAPRFMKYYMIIAVIVLMLITSMGIFGFLSKAHNDQNLVSGDVTSKIAIYDEKIRTAKDNIDANRKALKQMDEAVDQVMGRSNDEKGADKAVQLRRSQQKERTRLQSEITSEQKIVAQVNEERAPIAAEVRKVEAEVGPIKYIAKFIYGEHGADENMLEKAVTWIIMLIVIVFDPLAVIMLLAAQMTFGWKNGVPPVKEEDDGINPPNFLERFRKRVADKFQPTPTPIAEIDTPAYEPDDGPLTDEQVNQIQEIANKELPTGKTITLSSIFDGPGFTPIANAPVEEATPQEDKEELPMPIEQWNKMIEEAEKAVQQEQETTVEERVAKGETYIDNDGVEVALEPDFPEDPKKKTYMTKDEEGKIQVKNR